MTYRKTEFDEFNGTFTDKATDFLNNDSPTSVDLGDVIDAYNAVISYSEINYEDKRSSTKEYITENINANRATLQRCFEKLNIPVSLPGKLLSIIHYLPNDKQFSVSTTQTEPTNIATLATQSEAINVENSGTQVEPIIVESSYSQSEQINLETAETQTDGLQLPNANDNSIENNPVTMVQTKEGFLKTASSVINYKYNGDPLKLNSFLTDVELVMSLAEGNEMKAFCLTFIKSRMEGRAEEALPDTFDSIEALSTALKSKIKPDNSNIIEGRMTALQLRKGDYSKFANEAEKLAEALRRTLIVEGLTKTLAEEQAIKKTKEICRKVAKSEIVKSVLESSKFDTPEDATAAFITQSDKARKEFKEAQAAQKKPNNNGNANGNGKQNKANFKNQNGQNGNNSNQNSNGRSNNYRGNNRGRGQNQQQNRDRNNGNNRSNRNEHTIRVVTGAPSAPPAEQIPPQQEQFFRIES